jgi:DNA-binding response OmpR family regulator
MRVLFIDKEGDLFEQITAEINESYVVDLAGSAMEGAYLTQVNDYDAIIVGPSVNNLDAGEVCEKTRQSDVEVPILLISDRDCSEDRLKLLDSGADVCLGKSTQPKEIKAQLRVFVRRKAQIQNNLIIVNKFILDVSQRKLFLKKRVIDLRRKEYELLEYLFINKNKIISKEKLLEHVWEDGLYVFSNTVEVTVRNVRMKVGGKINNLIETIRGFGYVVKG